MTGNEIKTLRGELGMTSSAFAMLLGVNPSTLYRWESEGEKEVKADPNTARILAAMLQVRQTGGGEQLKASLGAALLVGGGLFALFKLLEYLFSDDKAGRKNPFEPIFTPHEAAAQSPVVRVVQATQSPGVRTAGAVETKGAAGDGQRTGPTPTRRVVRKTTK